MNHLCSCLVCRGNPGGPRTYLPVPPSSPPNMLVDICSPKARGPIVLVYHQPLVSCVPPVNHVAIHTCSHCSYRSCDSCSDCKYVPIGRSSPNDWLVDPARTSGLFHPCFLWWSHTYRHRVNRTVSVVKEREGKGTVTYQLARRPSQFAVRLGWSQPRHLI